MVTKEKAKTAERKAPRKRKASPPADVLLTVVLDRSGSMEVVREATIRGFNDYVADQRKADVAVEGNIAMTLVQFDDQYEVNFVAEPIGNVPELSAESYVPRGWTALNDAIVRAIHATEEVVGKQRVVVMIITDGQENFSTEFQGPDGLRAVAALIEAKETEDHWTFVFMGANIDAFAEAQRYNIPQGNVMGYQGNTVATGAVYAAASVSSHSHRASGQSAVSDYAAPAANTPGVTTAHDHQKSVPSGRLDPKVR